MDALAVIAGIIMSLAASYLPGFAGWYAALSGEYKRLVMLGLLFLAALVVFLAGCTGLGAVGGLTYSCDLAGAQQLAKLFVLAAVANQTTYQLSPQRKPKGEEAELAQQ